VNVTYSRAGRDDLAILFAEGAIGSFSDAELLRRFATDPGDAVAEVAFAALVDRHGPTVPGVCRRVRVTGTQPTTRFRLYSSSLPARPKPCDWELTIRWAAGSTGSA
jgi:hypothetical protein